MRCGRILFLIFILFYSFHVFATNKVSTGTGSWATAATWSPVGVPVAGDNITILTGHTITMNSNPGACANLTINGTATWATAGRITNVSGNLTMNNGGIITGTATGILNVAGTFSVPSAASVTIGRGTLTVTGTTTIDGTLDFNSITGVKTLGDITIDAGGTLSSSLNSAITITGSFTNNGTFTSGTGIYTFSGAGKSFSGSNGITFAGAVTMTGSYTNSNIVNVIVTGNLTGAGSLTQGANSTLQIGGTSTITTLTATANPNLVTYNGAAAQTIKATTYYNLTITSGNTATAGATFTCNGNLNITSGTFASGAFTITVSGATSISGGILAPSVAGTGIFNLQSLVMTGGSVAGNATGHVNVATTFNASSGTATIGACAITVTGVTTVDGTINFSVNSGVKTLGDVTIDASGIWQSTGNSPITISGTLTNNGTFTSGTGAYTFSGAGKSITGTNAISFSTAAITGTYTNSDAVSLTVTGVLSGTGGLTQGASSSLFLGGTPTITTLTATANPNLVTYNGAAAQTIKGTTYYNLTITSGNTATAGATFTCNGNLNITSGTFASGAFTITVSGATSISGGTLSTSNAAGIFNLQSLSLTSGSVAGSATGAVNVATTLSVPSGAPTIGRCNLTVTGATSITGSLTFNNVTGAKILGDVTVNGGGTWSSTVVLPFKINGNLSNSGTFTSNNGVYTLAGASKTISGTLSINSITVTGSYTNNATLTVTTALIGAGTFSQGTTGTLNIGTTVANFSVTTFNASASGNTVNYNLAGAQNVRTPADGAYSNLTIGGTGTKTLLAATTINGNLSISSTLAVGGGNFAINLGGNWTNTGTFTSGTGTVTLNGSGAQTITKTGGETFNNLTVSGSGTKTLGSAITTSSNLIINSTLDVTASNFGVTVKKNWTNNGTFTPQNGTVTFNGAVAQTIGGTSAGNFYNITQSNAAGVLLAQSQNLIGALTISVGTFTATGFNFTLISNASGTASIATIPAGANFAGNIIMQRYTGTGPTDWRFLSSAVSGATIANWSSYFATSGFTGATCNPSNCATCGSNCNWASIYTYNETVHGSNMNNGFVAATNVTNSISNGYGFWVYLGPNPVTYSVTGPPNTFSQSPTITYTPGSGGASNDGWNMIANPYPCAIDWTNASWTKTNLNNAIYIYNSSTGSFASFVGGVGNNGGTQYIASQQSFWIQAKGASPAVTMVEAVKTTAVNPSYLREAYSPNTSHYPMAFKDFPIPLNVNNISNSLRLTANGNGYDDETFIQFTQGATNNFDTGFDAWKIKNLNPSIPSISSVISANDSLDLSINSYPPLTSDVNIPIRFLIPHGYSGTYSIRRDSLLMLPMSSCLILEDLATGNMVDLRANISYSFTIADTTKAPRFLLHISAPISKQSVSTHCNNDSTGKAIAKGTGIGPWNYIWKNASGNTIQTTNNSSTSDTLFYLATGTYSVQVSGGTCGMVTDTIQIKSSSTFSLASNFSNVSCNGLNDGTAVAIASGGSTPYAYLWNNSLTTQQISNLSAGNYSVTVTDSLGCSQTQTFSIAQPAALHSGFTVSTDTVNLSVNNSISFTDTSIGAQSNYWNFGDTTALDTSLNPTHNYNYQGTYTVTLIVSNGSCSDTSRKIIFVVDSLNLTSVSQIINSSSVNIVYENGTIYLAFDLPEVEDVNIGVYNLLGEKIFGENAYYIQKTKIKLDVPNVSTGIYIAVAQMTDAVISKKFLFRPR